MKKYVVSYCIGLLIIAFLAGACSPQKRLNRLTKNNPELLHPDTVFKYGVVSIPEVKKDTSFNASIDTSGLTSVLSKYKNYIDSTSLSKITTSITKYVIDRPCLKDTFKVELPQGGYVKFYQKKGMYYYSMWQPPKEIKYKQAIVTNHFNVTYKNNWNMFWFGIGVVPVLAFITIIILKIIKTYTHG